MKLGIFSWYGYRASLTRRLDLIRSTGFDSAMLWGGAEEIECLSSAVAYASSIGLEIENLHIPFERANDLWSLDNQVRGSFVKETLDSVRQCRDLGIPMLVMHISKCDNIKEANQFGLQAFSEIVEVAQQSKISIAVENTRRVNLVEEILNHFPGEHVGLCYDTSHAKLYEEEEFYLLKKYPQRLKCLHISDNDGKEDRHWKIGQGILDWDHFVEVFPQRAYDGVLSLEVYPKNSNELEEEHLRDAYVGVSNLRDRIANQNQLTSR